MNHKRLGENTRPFHRLRKLSDSHPTLYITNCKAVITKNRLKRQSLKHVVKNLQKKRAEILEPGGEILEPDTWVTKSLTPQIRLEVPGLEKKGVQTQAPRK